MTFEEIRNEIGRTGATAMVFDGDCHRTVERVESGWAKFDGGKVVDWLENSFPDRPEGYVLAYRMVVPRAHSQGPVLIARGIAARIASGSAGGTGS